MSRTYSIGRSVQLVNKNNNDCTTVLLAFNQGNHIGVMHDSNYQHRLQSGTKRAQSDFYGENMGGQRPMTYKCVPKISPFFCFARCLDGRPITR